MSTGERQREIIPIFLNRRLETMSNLAKQLGVSERTVRRYVLVLTTDYPLETVSGRHGGVRLSDWYSPYMNLLSGEEQKALKIAASVTDDSTAGLLIQIVFRQHVIPRKVCTGRYRGSELCPGYFRRGYIVQIYNCDVGRGRID